jgi:hypothetical protein
MLPYGIETYLDRLYPKGGVAPLRHQLATYEYLEKQRRYQEQAEPIDVIVIAQAATERILCLVTRLVQHLARPFGSEG